MKKTPVLLAVLATFMYCTKKNQDPAPLTLGPVGDHAYYPTAVGNYWVYEEYELYADGKEIKRSKLDSVRITRDTLIDGNHYAVLEGRRQLNSAYGLSVIDCLRDSSGFLVNQYNEVLLSPLDFKDSIQYDYSTRTAVPAITSLYSRWMEPTAQVKVVPAGEFSTVNFKQQRILGFSSEPETFRTEKYDHCYAKNIGLVVKQYNDIFAYVGLFKIEKRLIRYRALSRQ